MTRADRDDKAVAAMGSGETLVYSKIQLFLSCFQWAIAIRYLGVVARYHVIRKALCKGCSSFLGFSEWDFAGVIAFTF
jgi:hypothetical protein